MWLAVGHVTHVVEYCQQQDTAAVSCTTVVALCRYSLVPRAAVHTCRPTVVGTAATAASASAHHLTASSSYDVTETYRPRDLAEHMFRLACVGTLASSGTVTSRIRTFLCPASPMNSPRDTSCPGVEGRSVYIINLNILHQDEQSPAAKQRCIKHGKVTLFSACFARNRIHRPI